MYVSITQPHRWYNGKPRPPIYLTHIQMIC